MFRCGKVGQAPDPHLGIACKDRASLAGKCASEALLVGRESGACSYFPLAPILLLLAQPNAGYGNGRVPNGVLYAHNCSHARFYFAYGSNMDFDQMKFRCPGAEYLGRSNAAQL